MKVMESDSEGSVKHVEGKDTIVTFKDRNILSYSENEPEKEVIDFENTNTKTRDAVDGLQEILREKDSKAADKQAHFRRKRIEVIRKNQRVIDTCNGNKVDTRDNDNSKDSGCSITNFNKNFLVNEDGIFEGEDHFYDQLKMNKRKKVQDIKTQFESNDVYRNSSGKTDFSTTRVESGIYEDDNNSGTVVSMDPNDPPNPNNDKLCLSLETEFCRNISNLDRSNKMENCHDAKTESPRNDVDLESSSDEPNTEDSVSLQRNSVEQDSILYQKPLDFGVSSTLEFLRSRGDISGNNVTINQVPNDGVLRDNLFGDISIFHTDENGNILDQKEAFKRLCWKFHGQKVNKNKLEKMFRNHVRNN